MCDKDTNVPNKTDFISREAAIRSAFKLCRNTDYPFIDDIQNAIEEIPAADVRPVVHGEWWPAKDGYYGHVMCSACHKIESHKTDFCPSCGADMRTKIETQTE